MNKINKPATWRGKTSRVKSVGSKPARRIKRFSSLAAVLASPVTPPAPKSLWVRLGDWLLWDGGAGIGPGVG